MKQTKRSKTAKKIRSLSERLGELERRVENLADKDSDKLNPDASIKKLDEIAKTFATITASIAGTAFVFYAIGFVIVNLNLMTYGIHEFELIKPAYLSAGIVFVIANLLPIGLALASMITLWLSDMFKGGSINNPVPEFLLGIFLSVSVSLLVLLTITEDTTPDFHITFSKWLGNVLHPSSAGNSGLDIPWGDFALYFFSVALLTISLSITIMTLASSGGLKNILASDDSVDIWATFFKSSVLILSMAIMLFLSWCYMIYPKIHPAFGGGRPVNVQLVITEASNESLFTSIGIHVKDNLTEKIKLVDDSKDWLIVVLPNSNSARLRKDLIANILYFSQDSQTAAPLPFQTPFPEINITATPTSVP